MSRFAYVEFDVGMTFPTVHSFPELINEQLKLISRDAELELFARLVDECNSLKGRKRGANFEHKSNKTQMRSFVCL